MHFTRLRLTGFKSFVDPTELIIEPGTTGVVGPNGCGKSNLVEAIRWVMGETSAKKMRGGEMDDVIFAGTSNRPARNLAEVQLDLDNADRGAPAQFNDGDKLEVTRRIEREQGSRYVVNGHDVRPATSNSCSQTPTPARNRPRSSAKAKWAPSSMPNRRNGAAFWKKPPVSAGCIRAATKPSCGYARRKPTSAGSTT